MRRLVGIVVLLPVLAATAVVGTGATAHAATPVFETPALLGGSGFGDGGPGVDARVSRNGTSGQIAVAADGRTVFADPGANEIRQINPDGTVQRVVGTGDYSNIGGGFSGDGGQAVIAALSNPTGLAVAPDGTMYIADEGNGRIREVSPSGIITTIAGTGSFATTAATQSAATAAVDPRSLFLDAQGDLYFTETDNESDIRELLPNGEVQLIAGRTADTYGTACPTNSDAAVGACIDTIGQLAVNSAGDVFFTTNGGEYISEVSNGILSRYAGYGDQQKMVGNGDGGPALSSILQGALGLSIDSSGELLIADGDEMRAVNSAGTINDELNVPSGDAEGPFVQNGSDLDFMNGSAVDQVASDGTGSLLVGGSDPMGVGDGLPAVDAAFDFVTNVAPMSNGDTVVGDKVGRVWTIDSSGVAHLVAGSTTGTVFSGEGGQATDAVLPPITTVATGPDNSIYIGGSDGTIREVDSGGVITTIASNIDPPTWIDVASDGTVFYADASLGEVFELGATGTPTVVAGGGGDSGRQTVSEPATSLDLGPVVDISLEPGGTASDYTMLVAGGEGTVYPYDYTVTNGAVTAVMDGGDEYTVLTPQGLLTGDDGQLDLTASDGSGNTLTQYAEIQGSGASGQYRFGITGNGDAAVAPDRSVGDDPDFDPVFAYPVTGLAAAPSPVTGVTTGWDEYGPYVAYTAPADSNDAVFGQLLYGDNTPPSYADGETLYPRNVPGMSSVGVSTSDATLGDPSADGAVTVSLYVRDRLTGATSAPTTVSFVPQQPTTCSLTRAQPAVYYSEHDTVTATVSSFGNTLKSEPITISAKTASGSVGPINESTGSSGSYVLSSAPSANTTYTMSFAGGSGYGSLLPCSASTTVDVASLIKGSLKPQKIKVGKSTSISAMVSPGQPGQTVTLQLQSGNSWRAVSSKKLNAKSTATWTVKAKKKGALVYRVALAANNLRIAAASDYLNLRVT